MNEQSIDLELIRAVAEAADIGTPPRKFVKLLEFVHGLCIDAYQSGLAENADSPSSLPEKRAASDG
ncbi:hypothetical protein J7376_19740 [Paracoccus sp. R12_1]|uniref:hypothetical protein n=1 Tax=unclassified Paracoccus (in: a-proteobacteria) TaxID=2688777 RepID=UPI001ADC38F6|nr:MULTISPECIES: hypothetical protein [unclassified Paracoccus (in: a-proteobacteria)]MBO9457315.1 hypothetical protein [Paracoccus sp. R12_2]MBO9488735.1 hypothetical protein [Paracoccus sp. R12_1]